MVVVDKLGKIAHFIPLKSTFKEITISDIFMKEIFKLHGIKKKLLLIEMPNLLPNSGRLCSQEWVQN